MLIFKRPFPTALQRIALAVLLLVLCTSGVQEVRASTQATTIVTFVDFVYNTPIVYITAGDTVNWQGNFMRHPLASDDGLWTTHNSGSSFNFIFQNPGSFRYYCTNHGGPGGAGMSGMVNVTGPFTAYMPLVVK